MLFCLNGRFIAYNKATVSVLDNGFLYADGFYDTLRVYDGVLFELPLHLKRIADSAKTMNISLPHAHVLGEWLLKIVKKNSLHDARVRITITRGAQGWDFFGAKKPTVVITCECLKNAKGPIMGETACTMRLTRPWPSLKTLGGLAVLAPAALEKKRREADHVLMVDDLGFVREGVTSNVFVVKNGRLITPKNGILKGLTRKRVIQLARSNGLTVMVRDFKTGVLKGADEIFLTNRIREIVPIVRLNGRKVGKGTVGRVTKRVIEAYKAYVARSI